MSAYNHPAGYFERNFIMTIARCFSFVRTTALLGLLCMLCMAASAQAPSPVKYDSNYLRIGGQKLVRPPWAGASPP